MIEPPGGGEQAGRQTGIVDREALFWSLAGVHRYYKAMGLPAYSTRQLFVAITVIGVGCGAIAYSLRVDDISARASSDEHSARTIVRVIGWSIACLGLIPLITKRSVLKMLAVTLLAGLPGLMIGVEISSGQESNALLSGYIRRGEVGRDLIPWIGMAIGSALALLCIVFVEFQNSIEKKKR